MKAFVLRISPSGVDQVKESLDSSYIIIGWSKATGLLEPGLSRNSFRKIISETYYQNENNLRKAGSATGHMWRFIRDMEEGDLVVVPYGSKFYVAQVTGAAIYLPENMLNDTSYRRPVKWLNDAKPIPRKRAKAALVSRMKTYGTCAAASDLIEEIKDCLGNEKNKNKPTFESDLKQSLVLQTLNELRNGRLDSFAFEHLIKDVLLSMGATESIVVPRSKDEGADVLATFVVAGMFQQKVAVQAKHWQPEPPVGTEVVEQLIQGLEAESANYGMVITSGTISEKAVKTAEEYYELTGTSIELIDGEQFAQMVVEHYAAKS